MKPLIIVSLVVAIAQCNIWDNVFSKTREVPRIHLDADFRSQFVILRNDRSFFVTVDYDVDKRLATIDVETEITLLFFVTRIKVATLQANFKTMEAMTFTPLSCHRYLIQLIPQGLGNTTTKFKDDELLIYYMNTLFEFSHSYGVNYFFLLNPDLLGKLNPSDIPKIGIWIDQSGRVVDLNINGQRVQFINDSLSEQYQCGAAPEKLDKGMIEQLYQQFKQYL